MTQSSYPYLPTSMTETTNFQPKKSNAGTSTPSRDSQGLDAMTRPTLKETQAMQKLPPEVAKAIAYLEYRRLRHKHPHV